jgi:hypothetical protein
MGRSPRGEKVKKLFPLFLLCLVPALADGIQIHVYTALAPNAFGSPSYGEWVTNDIYALQHGLTAYGTPGTPAYFEEVSAVDPKNVTVTSFASWMGTSDPGTAFGPAFAHELGNRAAFPLFIDGGGATFSISELSFTASSSDAGDVLGFSFGQGSYAYSNQYVGGIINPDNSITYVTGGPSNQLVNFLWGRGSGNGLWPCDPGSPNPPPCTTPAEQQAAIDSLAAQLAGQSYTGTYTLQSAAGDPIASGSGTFNITSEAPEPQAFLLAGTGLVLACLRLRRRTHV